MPTVIAVLDRAKPFRLQETDDVVEFVERQPDWSNTMILGGRTELDVENKEWIDSVTEQIGKLFGGGPYESDRHDKS